MKVFVVIMRRYGDRDKHSYVIGVYTNADVAEEQGKLESVYRGGKYDPDIREFALDKLHRVVSAGNILI